MSQNKKRVFNLPKDNKPNYKAPKQGSTKIIARLASGDSITLTQEQLPRLMKGGYQSCCVQFWTGEKVWAKPISYNATTNEMVFNRFAIQPDQAKRLFFCNFGERQPIWQESQNRFRLAMAKEN